VNKDVWHFYNQEFHSEEDALKAARERVKRWKYRKISATAMETKRKRVRQYRIRRASQYRNSKAF